ncbi:T3SS effector HopA1 family protein [Citricoccus sp. NPDC079358]|uniref:T3SS effector HopA1 family protein n=1 Tax=Citricoccus sp. NPDC079358 TaxID=3154653 RepID=UPI00344D311E
MGSLAIRLYTTLHSGQDGMIEGSDFDYSFDTESEMLISAATPMKWRFVDCPVVMRPENLSGLVVHSQGLRVFVPDDRVEADNGHVATIRMTAIETRLSAGFVFFNSTSSVAGGAVRVLRLYLSERSVESAVETWKTMMAWQQETGACFRTKILSRRNQYPRRDAIVVYFHEESLGHLPDLVRVLATGRSEELETSVLCRRVGPGMAIAWEPYDPEGVGRRSISFGEHRTENIAKSMLTNWWDGEDFEQKVSAHLETANIDPGNVWRNGDSLDLSELVRG